jgi:toxin CptA
MTSAPAISFDYRPSRRLALAGATMGVLAVAVFVVSDVLAWIRWTGVLATVIYTAGWLWQQRRNRVAAVLWHADGSLTLADTAGHELPAKLARPRLFAGVILLNVRWQGGRQALLLCRDNLPPGVLREMRIRLASAPPGGSA